MTEKIIQVNIEELKKYMLGISNNLKMIQNYSNYGSYNVFLNIHRNLDEQKLISVSDNVKLLETNFDLICDKFSKLKEILKQGGCEFD